VLGTEGKPVECLLYCQNQYRSLMPLDGAGLSMMNEGRAKFVRGSDGMSFITDGTRLYPMVRPGRFGVARVLLQEPGGDYFRCEYQFSDSGSRGLGQRTRAGGQTYDLSLK
jgi:hypothetical protein